MFNEDIKKEYIAWKTGNTTLPEGLLDRIFIKTSKFEEKFGKDVSSFTADEIRYFYKMLNTPSANYLVVINSALSLYTQWCLEHDLVPFFKNHYLDFSLDELTFLVNHIIKKAKIIDKETIYSWIEALENPSEQFILLALFEGISGKDLCELVHLRLSDFDGNKVTLHTGKDKDNNNVEVFHDNEVLRTITVSNKLVHLAHQSAEEDTYYQRHENDGNVYYTAMPYLPDKDLILKNYPNIKQNVSAFALGRRHLNKINRIKKIVDNKFLTATNIITSGKINFIKDRCDALNISGEEFLNSEHIKELDAQFNCKTVRSQFYRMYGKYLPN